MREDDILVEWKKLFLATESLPFSAGQPPFQSSVSLIRSQDIALMDTFLNIF